MCDGSRLEPARHEQLFSAQHAGWRIVPFTTCGSSPVTGLARFEQAGRSGTIVPESRRPGWRRFVASQVGQLGLGEAAVCIRWLRRAGRRLSRAGPGRPLPSRGGRCAEPAQPAAAWARRGASGRIRPSARRPPRRLPSDGGQPLMPSDGGQPLSGRVPCGAEEERPIRCQWPGRR